MAALSLPAMDMGLPAEAETAERLLSQRVAARAVLSVMHKSGRTRLQRLYQEGAAKIRLPRSDDDPLEAILINTAGGMTGGDRLAWQVDVSAGAALTVTTQASEKLYRAASGRAELRASLSVGQGARLAWLPQETIMFNRAAFSRRLDVEFAVDARILIAEATVFGRCAMGERVERGVFRDRWRVSSNGRLVHAEDFAIGPDVDHVLARPAMLGGAAAMATVLMIGGDAGTLLDAVRDNIGDTGGASFWEVRGFGKLLARLYAEDGFALRKRLVPLLAMLNGRAGLPKCWSL